MSAIKRWWANEFGGAVQSIFSDEPQFSRKTTLGFAGGEKGCCAALTDDLPDTFRAARGRAAGRPAGALLGIAGRRGFADPLSLP